MIARYQPASFSEHLAWSSHGDTFFNDLLPVPYDRQTLSRVCDHIDRVQERLQRRMLLENPSTYVEFDASTMSETAFVREVLKRTGCGLLLDVNNVHVSCTNHGRDALAYLRDNTALAEHEITTEIDRYIAWPGQALSYYLGQMQIEKSRAQAEEALGSKFDLRAFHDTVLSLGSVTLPQLEARINQFIADKCLEVKDEWK